MSEPWSYRETFKRAAQYHLETSQANGAERAPELITAIDLMAKVFPEPRWAIPGVIPDGATMLVGKPKQGKSWLMLQMALAIAYGGKALGQIDVEPGEVLLLCLEDNPRRLQERLRILLDGEPPPAGLTFATEWPLLNDGGADMLLEWTVAHTSARMIGIDVLTRLRPPAGDAGGGDIYQRDYQMMRSIKAIADETGVPSTVVHHTRKANADDPFDTISGTNGLAAAADTALILTRERGVATANLYVRGRDVEESDMALKFDAVSCQWYLLGAAQVFSMGEGRHEIVTLLSALGESTPKEIADHLKRDRVAVRKTLSRMFHDNQVDGAHGKYRLAPNISVTPVTRHTT